MLGNAFHTPTVFPKMALKFQDMHFVPAACWELEDNTYLWTEN